MAFAGGLLLGTTQAVLSGYLPLNSVFTAGVRPALPFFALFALLLFWPLLRRGREAADPLAGVDPPPPGLAARTRSRTMTLAIRILGICVGVGFVLVSLFGLDSFWLLLMTQALVFATIFLSITVITGMGGQVSLCQATFAAVGAFTTGQLVERFGMSVLLTMVIGAALAAAVGAVLALPALRLGGVYLALATLAFALAFESVLLPLDWVGAGTSGLPVPRPVVGPIDFADERAFFLLCLVVLGLVATFVTLLRRGTTGRFLDAIRGSEPAAASIGINPFRSKVVAFAVSAGIAGLGGSLLAMLQGQANPLSFATFFGLFWVVIVSTLGTRTIEGAVYAGFALVLVPEILEGIGVPASFNFVLFGLGALTYARHTEGIVEFQSRRIVGAIDRLFGFGGGEADTSGGNQEDDLVASDVEAAVNP
ncbi:MAG: branched-chain amino acid ABC transporter permease [Acidimicrobiia bacterium]|nr:branched-chain amino acid ABC transporter permease [Acidimicrobiia bacterium]